METYGADALRLYLINSGLVRGEEQRFSDAGVKDMTRRTLLPWYNAFQFLMTYAAIDGWSPDKGLHYGSNVLDQWVLSRLQSLEQDIGTEMRRYRLYNVVPRLLAFIDDLTNGYIRLNRDRFWGKEITADKIAAYSTLYTVIEELTMVMAPFTPFLAEHLYQELAKLTGRAAPKPLSVHLCSYPDPEEDLIQPRLEEAVSRMQQVILLGRQQREEVKVNLRKPLRRLTIIHRDAALLDELRELESFVKRELNVKEVHYDQAEDNYIALSAKPNFPLLGKRLGPRMKEMQARIAKLSRAEIDTLQESGALTIDGEEFSDEEIVVLRQAREGTGATSNRFISIALDCAMDDELIAEGLAREVVNRSRKELNFNVADRIEVVYSGAATVVDAVARYASYVAGETLAVQLEEGDPGADAIGTLIGDDEFNYRIRVAHGDGATADGGAQKRPLVRPER
jgi:isoleucyl-tRNA synthetase